MRNLQATETGSVGEKPAGSPSVSKGTLIGGIFAGLAASACCLGPFVLLTLGVSGSWIGNFSAMEPFRPLFIGVTAILLGLAFRKLYLVPQSCEANAACASPDYLRKQRLVFWIVTVLVIAVIAFPWYGPLLLDD